MCLANLSEAMKQTRRLCRCGRRTPPGPACCDERCTGTRSHLADSQSAASACKCSVFVDTIGREVTITRPVQYDAVGWPTQLGQRSLVVAQDSVGSLPACLTYLLCPALYLCLPLPVPGLPARTRRASRCARTAGM